MSGGRPTKQEVMKRRARIKKLIEENPEINNSEINKELRKQHTITSLDTIAKDRKQIEKDIEKDTSIEEMPEYINFQDALKTLEKEESKVRQLRKESKNETAKAQYSRLIKDIITKKADLAKELFALKLEYKEVQRPIYEVRIGKFEEAKKDDN